MLIITRRPDESFVIGEEIEVTILEVKGQAVSIGITAPRNVKILRAELTENKHPAKTRED